MMLDLIYIEWIDSAGSESTWDSDTSIEPAKIKSVGIFVKETKRAVTIGQSRDDNHPPQWDNLLVIPQSAIKRRRKMRLP